MIYRLPKLVASLLSYCQKNDPDMKDPFRSILFPFKFQFKNIQLRYALHSVSILNEAN
jgi:hypothetical protein